jgi:hypothetical protein
LTPPALCAHNGLMSEKHPYEAVGLRPDGDSFTVEVLGCQTEDERKRLARHYAHLCGVQ